MEGMTYQEWVRRRQGRVDHPRSGTQRQRNVRGVSLGVRERRRLVQLLVCFGIFLTVFIGKQVFPDQLIVFRDDLARLLHTDMDFTAAFSSLGRSLSEGEPVIETLGGLWTSVFGAAPVSQPAPATTPGARFQHEMTSLGQGRTLDAGAYLWTEGQLQAPEPDRQTVLNPFAATCAVPAAEPEVIPVDYTGPDLPENTTMDQYRLDVGETVSPVMGWVSSAFGWREHPVDGGEKFHNGVDLAVNLGTPVAAFAGGTVDYIGDSPVYGLYLQIRHSNGVTSFYAHCDKLLVQQGQSVAAGDIVAQAGETGNATGPHLHFELKRDGVRLNPIYYIETI
ncbi:M23 family peptidase [Pseudoflavonifractor sp. 524-17]|uniref:M23 family metallopeptidase n=1 Tax=Pseudoflavonifractor sp. 524-17 TaxID=2304577 RepID=UPI001379A546|nr:M23 family metallopeptidase [Pseudoflavonifractor sp. 524-17]NCE64229.1 M23 family peptidase [Pseudoflavonifractor sp. 524-17]